MVLIFFVSMKMKKKFFRVQYPDFIENPHTPGVGNYYLDMKLNTFYLPMFSLMQHLRWNDFMLFNMMAKLTIWWNC